MSNNQKCYTLKQLFDLFTLYCNEPDLDDHYILEDDIRTEREDRQAEGFINWLIERE